MMIYKGWKITKVTQFAVGVPKPKEALYNVSIDGKHVGMFAKSTLKALSKAIQKALLEG